MPFPSIHSAYKTVVSIATLILALCLLEMGCTSPKQQIASRSSTLRPDKVFVPPPLDSAKAKQRAKKAFTRGSVLAMQNRPAEAIIEFQEALQHDTSAAIYYALAKAYHDMVKNDLALSYVGKALEADSNFSEALELSIEIHISRANIEEALQACKRLVEIDPSPINRFRLGNVYELYDKTKATEIYNQVLEETDQDDVLIRLISTYGKMGKMPEYIRALERFHEKDPDNVYVFTELQDAYLSRQQYARLDSLLLKVSRSLPSEMLQEDYTRFCAALVADTGTTAQNMIPRLLSRVDNRFYFNADIHELCAYLCDRISDSLRMEEHFHHALQLADSSASVVLRIGIHFLQSKRYQRSAQHFRKYESFFRADPRMPLYTCFSYSGMDSLSPAVAALYRSLRIDSTFSEAWFQLGYAYDKLHLLDSSDYCYERALQLEPYNALACNNYAYSLSLRAKNLPHALELSRIAILADSTNASFLDTHGWILFNMGKHKEASEYLERAAKNNPTSPTLLEHLGDNYDKLGLTEKAADAWRKALELDASRTYLRERLLRVK